MSCRQSFVRSCRFGQCKGFSYRDLHPGSCHGIAETPKFANTGNRTSDFVVLVFVQTQAGPSPYPIKTLAAYSRVKGIAGGQTATASLAWTFNDLARHDNSGNTILYPGTYTLLLDQPTQAMVRLTLTGNQTTLDTWPKSS